MKIKENQNLRHFNTFGIDASCRLMVEYESIKDLLSFIKDIRFRNLPHLHIGEGSNLLFLKDYDGVVLRSAIRQTRQLQSDRPDEIRLQVGGGLKWDTLVASTLRHGWYGLENLSLIPGTVGAAAVQNIGAYGAEVGDFIESVTCINLQTGERRTFTHDECRYAYRHSYFKSAEAWGQWAVIYVNLRLSRHFTPNLSYGRLREELEHRSLKPEQVTPQQLRDIIIDIRRSKLPDPRVQGNAGSFFKNPIVGRDVYEKLVKHYERVPHFEVDETHVKIPAAWLIEQCGWKGKSMGTAAVHDVQPLVLVNLGGAKGRDIARLSEAVRHDVSELFGIDIQPEVNFI